MGHGRIWIGAVCILSGLAAWAPAANPEVLEGFLEQHCYDCHGGGVTKGGLDLEKLAFAPEDAETRATWVKVHDRLAAGEMPPAKKPQPKPDEAQAFLASLSKPLIAVEQKRYAEQGRTVLRRLNRVEYEYTLRDLLALPQLDIKNMLPPDGSAEGFDNQAEALELSYVHLARYLEAADAALESAMVLGPKPEKKTWDIPALQAGRIGQVADKGKEAVRIGDAVGLLRQPNSAQTPWWIGKFKPEADGIYRMKVKAFGFHWNAGQVEKARQTHVVSIYASSGTSVSRWLHSADVSRDPAKPTLIEFEAYVRKGEQVFIELVTMDDRNLGKTEMKDYVAPGVAIERIGVEGPLVAEWPPASYHALFEALPVVAWDEASGLAPPQAGSSPGAQKKSAPVFWRVQSAQPEEDARRLLKSFIERACRGSADTAMLERCFAIVKTELDHKVCFQDAMRAGYQAALCSPHFLFFNETPGRLDADALASRLSYFLWKSLPDAELLAAARRGDLNKSDGRRAQVERLLADERSDRFIADLLGQWMDLNRITFTQPDEKLYPEFDLLLQESMVLESHATFRRMLDLDQSVMRLIDSDELIINQRLAELYDIEGVEGVAMRPVKRPARSPRGGFLTQGAVMVVTANGTNTSPVTRGAWVLDRMLGTPPPKPPANVPAIEPDIEGATTIREQLAQHRDNAACRSCHAMIDPPGFALESFDVMGAWRDRYRSLGKGDNVMGEIKGRKPRFKLAMSVDSTGAMADGRPFKDIQEFRKLLLSDRRQIVRNAAQRLLAYATGAGVGFADRAGVEAVLDQVADKNDGLRSMVQAVVASPIFQTK